MLLYLLRHANADVPARSDSERWLSDKGVLQAKHVGRFCQRMGFKPEILLSSPLVRARQTAEHFATEISADAPEIADFLATGMEPEAALTGLQAYAQFESVMIVGHQPDFSMLIAHLTGMLDGANINIGKGSLTLLDVAQLRPGRASLEFSIPNRLMRL